MRQSEELLDFFFQKSKKKINARKEISFSQMGKICMMWNSTIKFHLKKYIVMNGISFVAMHNDVRVFRVESALAFCIQKFI